MLFLINVLTREVHNQLSSWYSDISIITEGKYQISKQQNTAIIITTFTKSTLLSKEYYKEILFHLSILTEAL